jgi:dihydroorotate dehydrogenase (NAD+) catalytic subunit
MKADLSVELAGIKLRNPLISASGPWGKDAETIKRTAQGGAGAVVTKTIRLKPAKVARPCMVKVGTNSLLNCEEWSDIDYTRWVEKEIRIAKEAGVPIIANLSGLEYGSINGGVTKMAPLMERAGADMLELHAPEITELVRDKVDIPIIVKLPAGAEFHGSGDKEEDLVARAKKAEKAGADAIVAVPRRDIGLKIDIETGKPLLGSPGGIGWISGESIKAATIKCVSDVARAVKIPVISGGGVMNSYDAIEALMAGATCLEIGTAPLLKGIDVFKRINNGIEEFMKRKGYSNVNEITGVALKFIEDSEKKGVVHWEGIPPLVNMDLCNKCGICEKVCSYGAIKVKETTEIDESACYGCGLCVSVCPRRALSLRY